MATSERKHKKETVTKKLFQYGIHMKILITKLTSRIIQSNLRVKYDALTYNKLG